MKKNLQTEAGQTSGANKNERVDALNQAFALFKRNYHNQFFKAFAQEGDLIAVKRLWLDALKSYSADTILVASMAVVKSSEFLPTLKTMLGHCDQASNRRLPDLHAAYAEACCAASPKAEQKWSHPAVYFAGREAGWHLIQSSPEKMAFPVFKEHYLRLCERVRGGEELNMPDTLKIEEKPVVPASKETSEKYISSLKSLLGDNDQAEPPAVKE